VGRLITKVTLYPTKGESREFVKAYLSRNNTELIHKFTDESWPVFYDARFHKHVSSFNNNNLFYLFLNKADEILTFSFI
jgi:hypothetical protein